MPPKPVDSLPPSDEFEDHGLLLSRVASGLTKVPTYVEPHVFVYDVNQQIYNELKPREADLKAATPEVRDAIHAAVGEIVMRKKAAELVGHEVSGLAAFDLYTECRDHIERHKSFFEKRLASRVLRALTLGRSEDESGSH